MENCKYCNYCKYFKPFYRISHGTQDHGQGACLKTQYVSTISNRKYYKKHAYCDSCDNFVYSIHNACGIEDSYEIIELPDLKSCRDQFRSDVLQFLRTEARFSNDFEIFTDKLFF